MTYAIEIQPPAQRDLQQLGSQVQKRVGKRIDGLARYPRAFGTEELSGDLAGFRKLRVGDYRVIYAVDDDQLAVAVWAVGHRSHIYETVRRRVRQ
ncbi:MAG: type II toxin-antitoxin system RelE/ParE family toxin [Armatimonadetes bacterium]|nr:type II toxin-antitoxin system RelE/ParE family toxin [Armatimonadota bacterium]